MSKNNIIVKKELCPQNHACPLVGACPAGAINQDGYNAPEIDKEKCISCGLCVRSCAYGAFTIAE